MACSHPTKLTVITGFCVVGVFALSGCGGGGSGGGATVATPAPVPATPIATSGVPISFQAANTSVTYQAASTSANFLTMVLQKVSFRRQGRAGP
jgi:hypothetical protein